MNHANNIETLESRRLFAGGPISIMQGAFRADAAELISITPAQADAPVPQYQTVPTYNWNGDDASGMTSIGSGVVGSGGAIRSNEAAELISITPAQADAPVPQYQTVPTYNWNGDDTSGSSSVGSGVFSSAAIGGSNGVAEFLGTSPVTIDARPQWQTVDTYDWID